MKQRSVSLIYARYNHTLDAMKLLIFDHVYLDRVEYIHFPSMYISATRRLHLFYAPWEYNEITKDSICRLAPYKQTCILRLNIK